MESKRNGIKGASVLVLQNHCMMGIRCKHTRRTCTCVVCYDAIFAHLFIAAAPPRPTYRVQPTASNPPHPTCHIVPFSMPSPHLTCRASYAHLPHSTLHRTNHIASKDVTTNIGWTDKNCYWREGGFKSDQFRKRHCHNTQARQELQRKRPNGWWEAYSYHPLQPHSQSRVALNLVPPLKIL